MNREKCMKSRSTTMTREYFPKTRLRLSIPLPLLKVIAMRCTHITPRTNLTDCRWCSTYARYHGRGTTILLLASSEGFVSSIIVGTWIDIRIWMLTRVVPARKRCCYWHIDLRCSRQRSDLARCVTTSWSKSCGYLALFGAMSDQGRRWWNNAAAPSLRLSSLRIAVSVVSPLRIWSIQAGILDLS